MMSSHRINRGFTLIESLVVITIVALLIAVLLPALKRSREHVRRTTCASNYRQFVVACNGYASDSDSHLPAKAHTE